MQPQSPDESTLHPDLGRSQLGSAGAEGGGQVAVPVLQGEAWDRLLRGIPDPHVGYYRGGRVLAGHDDLPGHGDLAGYGDWRRQSDRIQTVWRNP